MTILNRKTPNKKRLTPLTTLGIFILALGMAPAPLQAMANAPRSVFKLARTGLFAAASYFLYDTVRNDGKKTRSAVEKSTQTLKELFQEGTTQLKIVIGATHDETVALLKKQHEEAVRRLRKIEQQNRRLITQNGELQEKITTLVNGQQRIEHTLAINPAEEQPITLLDKLKATINQADIPTSVKEKIQIIS